MVRTAQLQSYFLDIWFVKVFIFQEEGRFELEWIDTANAWYAERQRRSKSSQSTHLLYKAIQVSVEIKQVVKTLNRMHVIESHDQLISVILHARDNNIITK